MRWLVFDYGEVISRRTEAVPALAARLGVDAEAFDASYWAARNPYDRGQADLDYWRAVAAPFGVTVDEGTSSELTDLDVAGWLYPEPATLELLADLDEAGVPLALLSNAPVSFGRVAERQPWTKHFRHLVFSGDLGVAKPDAEIWATLVERLGARPADCVFLDDRQENIDGALAAGLGGWLWADAADARTRLTQLSFLS
ncbi:HAD family phosphatase [Solihabitans fulvus]|uniref:HAD family phosphatase n=1 Tax=Solihabitans fulvus TaxID=1892852 RepID=A0A5B2XA54_9PSEU|nr:HAD family phosphatase [Solihabitans fulvus]KAA2260103.1 HAD family phosphatase [Solihabitans fulvus]